MAHWRYLGLAALVAHLGCSGASSTDAGDARTDSPASDAVSTDDGVAEDAPVVLRCGPRAVPYASDAGNCAAPAPVPDGGVPAPGRCTASAPTPAALLRTNQFDGDALVIPSGRRVQRATHRRTLSGFPMSILRLPGTNLLAISDGGIHLERLRIVDAASPTLDVVPGGEVSFPEDSSGRDPALFYGLAYDPAARVLYASGGGGNRVYAFGVSTAGALSADMARTIDLGITETSGEGVDPAGNLRSAFVAGIALSDDGTQVYAALERGHALGIYSTVTGRLLHLIPFATVDLGAPYPYAVIRRPGDTDHVYVSLWGTRQVAEVDVQAGAITQLWSVGKNPEELLFTPDGAQLYVADSDSDAVSVIDLAMPGAPVRNHYLGGSMSAPRGISPTALAWGPGERLYVVEANENAVAVLDRATFALVGRIPTEWYPTDVDVAPDGAVIVTTGKGVGTGPNTDAHTMDITNLAQGSVARYEAPSDADLAAGEVLVTRNNGVMATFGGVDCPAGADYDFPVPRVGSGAASTRIRHVVMVVRENKTYDAVLGDYAGTPGQPADGDATLTIVPAARMAADFPNLRALVARFAQGDNYYSNAEQSIQGHVWTTLGRTTDYTERSWLTTWGRAQRSIPTQGVVAVGVPEEGGIFQAMAAANVRTQNWGEVVNAGPVSQSVGGRYPGGFYNLNVADIDKARAFGNNAQRACDLASFSYILLPNDHTFGGDHGRPTPESMYQDNDEATGYLIDALSHSVYWPETLVVVVEDDPQDGADHVDNHRSLVLLASPWVRRGATTHAHYDEASLHHTIELILNVPAHNATVAAAAPMYDAFTNVPDYTPFRYTARLECPVPNPSNGPYAEESARMDFTHPDNAPGLSRLLWRMFHDGREPPVGPGTRGAVDPDGDGDGD